MKIKHKMGRWLALGIAVLLMLPSLTDPVMAMGQSDEDTVRFLGEAPLAQEETTRDRASTSVASGGSIPARQIEGRTLVPLHTFVSHLTEATYVYDKASGYAFLQAPNLSVSAGNGGTFLTANDRCLYGVAANRMIDGTLWVPLTTIAKACGVTATVVGGVVKTQGNYRPLTHASQFYDTDTLYWLSRIISAESKGEPLRGQMAVGNVVLNRVRHTAFPNGVYGVIFQKGQFTPVMNGTIYNTPSWLSVCVAKMCLEGYSINNDVLFFCNPKTSSSQWVLNNRTPAFTIARHTFYY